MGVGETEGELSLGTTECPLGPWWGDGRSPSPCLGRVVVQHSPVGPGTHCQAASCGVRPSSGAVRPLQDAPGFSWGRANFATLISLLVASDPAAQETFYSWGHRTGGMEVAPIPGLRAISPILCSCSGESPHCTAGETEAWGGWVLVLGCSE